MDKLNDTLQSAKSAVQSTVESVALRARQTNPKLWKIVYNDYESFSSEDDDDDEASVWQRRKTARMANHSLPTGAGLSDDEGDAPRRIATEEHASLMGTYRDGTNAPPPPKPPRSTRNDSGSAAAVALDMEDVDVAGGSSPIYRPRSCIKEPTKETYSSWNFWRPKICIFAIVATAVLIYLFVALTVLSAASQR